ncbi:MAG TPA: glycosyltransferase [Patescibacteria group bacterium]|nr:glycosyltransferase [Patescibacteria group bacterium]
MRVLHAPVVIANQSVVLADALRKCGIEATSLQYYHRDKRYSADINVCDGNNILKQTLARFSVFLRVVNSFDIYHFHFAETLLPLFLDLPILKLIGKKIVLEYHGSEIRPPFKYSNDYKLFTKVKITLNQLRIRIFAKLFADAEVVTTPDLLAYAPSAKFIPAAVEDRWLSSTIQMPSRSGKVIITHAPTSRVIKGSDYLISAVKQLQKSGLRVELDLVEELPPKEVSSHFERADIAVDQLLIGWYGLFAAEMMALGKPVVCYVRKDFERYAPGLPIVSTDTETLVGVLGELVQDAKVREMLGRRGPQFVRSFQSSGVIAKRFIELYKTL